MQFNEAANENRDDMSTCPFSEENKTSHEETPKASEVSNNNFSNIIVRPKTSIHKQLSLPIKTDLKSLDK